MAVLVGYGGSEIWSDLAQKFTPDVLDWFELLFSLESV